MTSSLVGSEMCIRDRPPAIPPQVVIRNQVPDPVGESCLASQKPMHSILCLLYTSDAADDM
eukprot:1319150-Prorocentrum_lima.AAC.1